jgi:hypothetical protein
MTCRSNDHIWQEKPGGTRCQLCNVRKPLPALRLRCEWCKKLFDWEGRQMTILREGIPRTCGSTCHAKLQHWERNREIHGTH